MDNDPEYRSGLLIAERPHLLRNDALTFDRYTAPKFFQHRRRRMAIDERLVLLFQLVTRMRDSKGNFTIVREQQESGSLTIEPANGHHPLRDLHQIHHRPPATLVAGSRNVPRRLVEQDVTPPLRS